MPMMPGSSLAVLFLLLWALQARFAKFSVSPDLFLLASSNPSGTMMMPGMMMPGMMPGMTGTRLSSVSFLLWYFANPAGLAAQGTTTQAQPGEHIIQATKAQSTIAEASGPRLHKIVNFLCFTPFHQQPKADLTFLRFDFAN